MPHAFNFAAGTVYRMYSPPPLCPIKTQAQGQCQPIGAWQQLQQAGAEMAGRRQRRGTLPAPAAAEGRPQISFQLQPPELPRTQSSVRPLKLEEQQSDAVHLHFLTRLTSNTEKQVHATKFTLRHLCLLDSKCYASAEREVKPISFATV